VQLVDLFALGVVDATLKHATAVLMCSNFNAVLCNSVKDELILRFSKLIETLLNDMISV